jgi:ribosomal protein S27AE
MAEVFVSTHPACPKCGSDGSTRIRREGLVHRFVAPHFGLFPWECGVCRSTFLARGRGNMQKQNGTHAMLAAGATDRHIRQEARKL